MKQLPEKIRETLIAIGRAELLGLPQNQADVKSLRFMDAINRDPGMMEQAATDLSVRELAEQLHGLVQYYNHERYHESLNNLTPADVYYGRGEEVLNQRALIKRNTLAMRRKMHYDRQATPMS